MSELADLSKPLMPQATAMWLIDNTTLTFTQIADFCELHEIEVQALADAEVGRGIAPRNPIDSHELTAEEIERCEGDETARLRIVRRDLPVPKVRGKGPRYTPVSKRGDKPDAVAYILKHHAELSDSVICKLIGTTKNTIESVRDRSHPNTPNMRPRHPAELGLCSYTELEAASYKALRAMGRDPEAEAAARAAKEDQERRQREEEEAENNPTGGFDFSNFLKSTGQL